MDTVVEPIHGLWVPSLTPFGEHGEVDADRFAQLAQSLLQRGVSGLVPFGSTGEANSLSLGEREALLHVLLEHGVPPEKLLPGTGACALPDAVRLSQQAVKAGCRGVLVLPPFYYKPVDDDGLFEYYARLIEGVGSDQLRLYLYHIPALSGVPISTTLIERLLAAYPKTIAGIKDSSRDWDHTGPLLDRFPQLAVVPGNGALLQRALKKGAPGCIAAIGNVVPEALVKLSLNHKGDEADSLQQVLTEFEDIVRRHSAIAAMKALLGRDAPAWQTVRAPLQPLSGNARERLSAEIDAIGLNAAAMAV